MQSYTEQELIDTATDSFEELAKRAANLKQATHHVIGKLPVRGTILEFNGLKYRVLSTSKSGHLHLELLKPDQEKEN